MQTLLSTSPLFFSAPKLAATQGCYSRDQVSIVTEDNRYYTLILALSTLVDSVQENPHDGGDIIVYIIGHLFLCQLSRVGANIKWTAYLGHESMEVLLTLCSRSILAAALTLKYFGKDWSNMTWPLLLKIARTVVCAYLCVLHSDTRPFSHSLLLTVEVPTPVQEHNVCLELF